MRQLDPFELGFARCTIEDLRGGDTAENAAVMRKVLGGEMVGAVPETVVDMLFDL